MRHEYVKGSLTNPNSPTVIFETQYQDATEWAVENARALLEEAIADYIPQTILDDELVGYIDDNLIDLAEQHREKINVRLRKKWMEWEVEND